MNPEAGEESVILRKSRIVFITGFLFRSDYIFAAKELEEMLEAE
jgi:hypothetical protein